MDVIFWHVPNPLWQRQPLLQVSAASATEQGDPARRINTAQHCLQEHSKKHKVLIWTPKIPIRSSDHEICQNKRDAQISHHPTNPKALLPTFPWEVLCLCPHESELFWYHRGQGWFLWTTFICSTAVSQLQEMSLFDIVHVVQTFSSVLVTEKKILLIRMFSNLNFGCYISS